MRLHAYFQPINQIDASLIMAVLNSFIWTVHKAIEYQCNNQLRAKVKCVISNLIVYYRQCQVAWFHLTPIAQSCSALSIWMFISLRTLTSHSRGCDIATVTAIWVNTQSTVWVNPLELTRILESITYQITVAQQWGWIWDHSSPQTHFSSSIFRGFPLEQPS